jgi:hypothetical protein
MELGGHRHGHGHGQTKGNGQDVTADKAWLSIIQFCGHIERNISCVGEITEKKFPYKDTLVGKSKKKGTF